MGNYLLSLDQSTQTTGYALFKDKKLIASGIFSPPDKDYSIRIYKLVTWVSGLIDSIDAVNSTFKIAIEDIQLQEKDPSQGYKTSYSTGVVTFKKLAHVQGALINLFHQRGIDYEIISSNTWKKVCGIKGAKRQQQKANAQEFVKKNYKPNPTEDEADAICIGHCSLCGDTTTPTDLDEGITWE